MLVYLLYFSTFITGVIFFDLMARALMSRRKRVRSINRRMTLLSDENASPQAVLEKLRLERGLDGTGQMRSAVLGLRRLYVQSGLNVGAGTGFLAALSFALAGGVIGRLAGFPLFGQLITAMFGLVVIPYVTMYIMRSKRIVRFTRQLPDALDVVVRSLKAGHPFSSAIGLVAREMADPVGSEFGILSDELSYGHEIDTALHNMVERIGAEELQFLAVALSIHNTSGGNLTEILQNLSTVIRNRFLMKAKIRALSAEGRFSAVLLSIFPFLIYLMIRTMSPKYFDSLYDSGIEIHVLVFVLVMMAIGNTVIYKMVNFDY